jgi:hypothetical protein
VGTAQESVPVSTPLQHRSRRTAASSQSSRGFDVINDRLTGPRAQVPRTD